MARFDYRRLSRPTNTSYHHVLVDWSQIHFFMTRHFIIFL